jgi:peroxin-1
LTNGTHQSRKGSQSSRSKSGGKRQDFSQFLYGADQDSGRKSRSTIDSRAIIAAKLEELKMLRKRERAIMRGDYSALHQNSGDQAKIDENDETNNEVVIEWKHVERSLATTRSSMAPEERKRLAAIYTEFVVGRKGDMPNGDGGREIGGRSSLM